MFIRKIYLKFIIFKKMYIFLIFYLDEIDYDILNLIFVGFLDFF